MLIDRTSSSTGDGSRKFRIALSDGQKIETVFLPVSDETYGLCLSTQVGCNMGCAFCFTASQRVRRNLTSEEIVGQAQVAIDASECRGLPTFVTLAGMGEPLANYANSVLALNQLGALYTPDILSLSTVGLVEQIRRLNAERRRFRIYVSLHSANEETRQRLVPMARYNPLNDLIAAATKYAENNPYGAVQMSYLLLPEINDKDRDILALKQLLKGRPMLVQVLAWNAVPSLKFQRVSDTQARKWADELCSVGVPAYFMPSKGRDIGAACGQLATSSAS